MSQSRGRSARLSIPTALARPCARSATSAATAGGRRCSVTARCRNRRVRSCRPYARTLSNGALRFHTDRCDVVALFCVRQAARGGLSQLCSSPAVHNVMLERRPDLCAALYEDLWRSRFGEEDATNKSAYPLPVWGV